MICVLRKVLKEFWNAECLPILCPFGGLSVTVAVAKQSWLGLSLSGWDRGEACAHLSCSHKPCSPCPVPSSDHLVHSTGKSSIRLQSSTEDASQRCLASDFLCFHAEWPCTAVEKTAAPSRLSYHLGGLLPHPTHSFCDYCNDHLHLPNTMHPDAQTQWQTTSWLSRKLYHWDIKSLLFIPSHHVSFCSW